MRLDEFKTQVLILHSEQSTLDNLSSGFGDRYTVHCATSGSEALNTLVDTPINVIISAQNLPGMSGLEALREAKKRSPDTIGILLAGSTDDGLEALVGDQEVFQVVRGNVTVDSILKLVDNATRQVRLMTLAESANDTAAGGDDTSAQHIVMETSDNGSTIISDGTGQLPTLDAGKISAVSSVGSRAVDLLVLTKDQEFLSSIKDSSRGMHTVHYASTLAQADKTIRENKVGVAVVDAAMVGDKVEQLTQHLRKGSQRLVAVVAGRRDDGEMLMDLINRGKVYRFLLKPVSPGRARLAIEASVKHHLEAPDAAFKVKLDATGTHPGLKAAAKPASKTYFGSGPKPKPKLPQQPAAQTGKLTATQTTTNPAAPPMGSPQDSTRKSVLDSTLSSTFGDDSSFTETVTGLISSVGKKFSRDADKTTTQSQLPAIEPTPVAPKSDESPLRNPKILGIGAAAVVVIAGTLFWLMGGSDEPTPQLQPPVSQPSINEADLVVEEVNPESTGADVNALLSEARLAREAGQIFNPLGSNAIELYAAASSANPENEVIAAELDDVIQQALTMAETALLESNLDDAEAALQRVSSVTPNNARLPFLTAQLSQIQLHRNLSDARAAIRETRFEDAANALAAARLLDIPDTVEIDAVAAELSLAQSQQRTDEVLALAIVQVEEGNLVSPPNDNARYYYELVLSNDPENAAARQGLGVVASKLALQARSEIENGNLNLAEDLLGEAVALEPSNSEIAAATTALANKRNAIAAQRRKAEEERAAAAEREAAEALAAEERAAQEAAEPPAVEDAAASDGENVAGKPATSVEDADGDASPEVADGTAADADSATDDTADQQAQEQTAADSGEGNARPTPTAISALNRTRYVAPKYPRSAQRRNVSGWVDIVFTVAMNGTVKDIGVLNSEPGDTFVSAATKAVEKWEFEPVVENGVLVEKRAAVRMMFALE